MGVRWFTVAFFFSTWDLELASDASGNFRLCVIWGRNVLNALLSGFYHCRARLREPRKLRGAIDQKARLGHAQALLFAERFAPLTDPTKFTNDVISTQQGGPIAGIR
jgi:hypothetical protein